MSALKGLEKKPLGAKKAAIRSELLSILDEHKKDLDFKKKERHLYSKILKRIAAEIFLLEEIK